MNDTILMEEIQAREMDAWEKYITLWYIWIHYSASDTLCNKLPSQVLVEGWAGKRKRGGFVSSPPPLLCASCLPTSSSCYLVPPQYFTLLIFDFFFVISSFTNTHRKPCVYHSFCSTLLLSLSLFSLFCLFLLSLTPLLGLLPLDNVYLCLFLFIPCHCTASSAL